MDKIKEVLTYIEQLKCKFRKALAVDYAIDADPYDNVARLKVLEKVEKFITRLNKKEVS